MGRGWYILVGLMTALIVILIGFAAYMTYEGQQGACAPGTTDCSARPPGAPGP